MRIDKVDSKVTKLWERSEERDAAEVLRAVQHEEKKKQDLTNHNKAQQEFALLDANDNEEIQSEDVEEEYLPTMAMMKENSSQNRTRLPKTAEACDRYLVSDRAGAALASAVLRDYGSLLRKIQVR